MITFARQLPFITYLLIFLLLQVILAGLLSYGKQQVSDSYQQQSARELENDFNFSLSHYRDISNLFFKTEINKPSILSLMERANGVSQKEQIPLRQNLLDSINPVFNAVKSKLRHVHFHLANGDSFLRMHMPQLFGDNLYQARESIRLIGQEHEFLEGFELGRHYYAIRYIYPLLNAEKKFIGSMETGISFQQFRQSLSELAEGEYFLLVRKHIGDKKLVTAGKEHFETSLLSNQFLMEKINPDDITLPQHIKSQNHIPQHTQAMIEEKIKKKAALHLREDKSFSLTTRVKKQDYLISFLPVKNIVNSDIGYLVKYARDSNYAYIENGYLLSYCIGTVLILFILCLYHWSTNKIFNQLNFQQNLIDSVPTPLFYTDSAGKYLGSNSTFNALFSVTEKVSSDGEKTISPPLSSILPPSIRPPATIEGHGSWEEEINFPDQQTGTELSFHCYTSHVENSTAKHSGLITAMFDITERKEVVKELSRSHAEIKQIFNTAAGGMRVIDKNHNVLRVNKRFLLMSGMDKQDLIGLKCFEIFGGSSCMSGTCPLHRIIAGEEWIEYEAVKHFPNGNDIPCIITATPYRDSSGKVVGIIEDFKDISDRKQFEQQLKQMARTDVLTGLMNRRGFLRNAEQMLRLAKRQNKELFLLFADLDNMKSINDDLGHQKGDFALQKTAELLKDTYRETDIIGRLGGDEFAVLLFDALPQEKENIVDRFQKNLTVWNSHSGEDFQLALSIGVVQTHSGKQEDMEALLHRADQAMYKVKERRKAGHKERC